jgi:hypothetical protein
MAKSNQSKSKDSQNKSRIKKSGGHSGGPGYNQKFDGPGPRPKT